MSLRIIKRDPSGEDKEVILQIDPTQTGQPVEQTFSVTGRALNATGEGESGVTIRIFDRGLNTDTLLGEGVTNSEGVYLVYYSSTAIPDGKLRADLVVMAFDVTVDPDLKLAESPVLVSALTKETVDVTIVTAEEFVGIPEYLEVRQRIEPLLTGVTIDAITLQGIEVIASKIDLESVYVADFLKARQLNAQYNSISEEVFYGLVRYDLPYNASELINTSDPLKREALEATTESNIINPAILDDIDAIITAFIALKAQDGLAASDGNDGLTAQLLSVAGLNATKRESFYTAYLENREAPDFWQKLVNDNVLTATERDNVRFAFQLGTVTQNYVPLVTELYNDNSLNGPEDLGELSDAQWLAFIDRPGVGVPNIDSGDVTAQNKQDYIDAIMDAVEKAFPSKVLVKDLAADVDYASRPVLQFGQDNPDYDIKADSPRRYIQNNPNSLNGQADANAARADVYQTRRLWHMSKGRQKTPIIKALETNDLTSANKIASVGKRNFVSRYAPELGGEEQARQIHRSAVTRSAASVLIKTAFSPQDNNVPTNVFSDGAFTEEDVAANPELEVLFGAQDYCNCSACRSSFGPAAYLVDLLNYFKETIAKDETGTPINNPNTSQPLTAWEVLKERRPDLNLMDLSCDNTNTTLPYIDLVNEVLENLVSSSPNNNRQTTRETNILRAEPEYLNKDAYDTLAAQKYPWVLPFNLWNEEGTTYSGQLEVKRAEITKVLDRRAFETAQMSLEEACISLGISGFMYNNVLRDTTFMEHYDGKNANTLNRLVDEDPTSRIGLLEEANLSFEQLNELLTMQFINADGSRAVVFNPPNSCALEDAELNFTSNDYILLHKFIRLSEILGWPFKTLDLVLSGLGFTNILEATIIALAELKQLEERLKRPITELITWIAPLSQRNYGSEPSEFDNAFLNPIFFTQDNTAAPGTTVQEQLSEANNSPVQLLTTNGDDLEQEMAPILVAALRLNAKDIVGIINSELAGSTANKNELSHLYRVSSFVRATRISVSDYLDLQAIMGSSPLAKPTGTTPTQVLTTALQWFNDLDTVLGKGFKVNQLNFLLREQLDSQYQQTTDDSITAELSNLRSALRRKLAEKGILLNVNYTNLTAAEFQQAAEDLLAVFLLFMEENDAATSLAVTQDTGNSLPDRDTFLDRVWLPTFGDLTAVRTQLDAITDLAQRYEYIMLLWYPEVAGLLDLDTEVSQLLAINTAADQAIIENLLKNSLEQESNPGVSALQLYTDFTFVSSTDAFTNTAPWFDHYIGLKRLFKLVEAINQLEINSEQLRFVLENTSETNWYPLITLPISPVATVSSTEFDSFVRLIRSYELEETYAVPDTYSIIGLLERINAGAYTQQEALQELADITGWNLADINFLISPSAFDLSSFPVDFRTENWIADIEQVISISSKFKISAEQLGGWTEQDLSFESAQQIKQAVKANYEIEAWYKIAADLRDKLRGKQRDALVGYILANNSNNFLTADDVYQYYLMDVETAPCSITSRLKLAISSVQLWVQRIRMNLESQFAFSDEDLDEWKWRKNFRVWEAARKVFLYPENWIEPELRDDKSVFFTEMEEELLQDEVTAETAERAYLNYLHKLDDVARMEMSGAYLEEDRNIFHVYARTKNEPHQYFSRKRVDGFRWLAWEKVEVDIEGDHLIPTIFNRRPMIFWPIFNLKPVEIDEDSLDVVNSSGDGIDTSKDRSLSKRPEEQVEIQLAYSEFKNGRWSAKKVSKSFLLSDRGTDPENYTFKAVENELGLSIETFFYPRGSNAYRAVGTFVLNNCTSEIEVIRDRISSSPSQYSVAETFRSYMKILENEGNDKFQITEKIKYAASTEDTDFFPADERVILNKTPGRFKLTYPITGVELLSEVPFFYEDGDRIFFVTPSTETFNKTLIIEVPITILNVEKPVRRRIPRNNEGTSRRRSLARATSERIPPINSDGDFGFDRDIAQLGREDFLYN